MKSLSFLTIDGSQCRIIFGNDAELSSTIRDANKLLINIHVKLMQNAVINKYKHLTQYMMIAFLNSDIP